MTTTAPLVLRHVLFFHRHGDRSPILTQIGDKWRMTDDELAFWRARLPAPGQLARLNRLAAVVGDTPDMATHGPPRHGDMAPLAQLTATGVEHMCAKGRALGQAYESFLSAHGHPTERVFVLSSNIDRTIQSVQCLLHGMFMGDLPVTAAETDRDVPTTPLFHVRTMATNVLAPAHSIKIFGQLERLVADDIVTQRDPTQRAEMTRLGDHLKTALGIPADRDVPWTAIRDGLTCRRAHGLPFPDGITDDMYVTMCEYDSWLWHTLFSRKDFCHGAYRDGVQLVANHLRDVVTSHTNHGEDAAARPAPLMSFFSAHDNSIVALLCALRVNVERVLPEYGTVVTFETYEDTTSGAFYLKVLFAGEPVTFAGHEHAALCPFSFFEQRVEEFLQDH